MAVNIPSLNVNAIGEGLKDQNNYEAILDILQRYRKELNFYLMNLDLDNMPAVAEDIDGVKITVGNNAGDIANLSITASEIQSNVGNVVTSVSTLSTTVTQNHANITQRAASIESTVTSITQDINDLDGDVDLAYSQISQLATDITAKVTIGEVTNYLSINRDGVQINANNIDLTGITTIYSGTAGNYTKMSGSSFGVYFKNELLFKIQPDSATGTAIYGESGAGIRFYDRVDFSYATVSGLDLRFA